MPNLSLHVKGGAGGGASARYRSYMWLRSMVFFLALSGLPLSFSVFVLAERGQALARQVAHPRALSRNSEQLETAGRGYTTPRRSNEQRLLQLAKPTALRNNEPQPSSAANNRGLTPFNISI